MPFDWRRKVDATSVRRNLDDVVDLSKKYVRETTVDPLKQLGRYAGFGCAGSLLLGIGSVFVLLGVLRVLQTETTAFHGDLSWLPYVIVLGLAVVEIAAAALAIMSGPARRRRPKEEQS